MKTSVEDRLEEKEVIGQVRDDSFDSNNTNTRIDEVIMNDSGQTTY